MIKHDNKCSLCNVHMYLETVTGINLDSSNVRKRTQLPRFHVPFWLSHILVYLFYLCHSFCSR